MKRSLYKVESVRKKIKIYCIYGVKRKAENILFGNYYDKRIKYTDTCENEEYKKIICPIHEDRYICYIYDCDGRMINRLINIMSYIN